MKTEVLLERLPDARYRATGSGRFALSVEGDTREAALNNFRKAALESLSISVEVVTVDLPLPEATPVMQHPWAWFAGIFKEDPCYGEHLAEIERNRIKDEETEAQKRVS